MLNPHTDTLLSSSPARVCRADIYLHICEDLVRNVPVFQACRPPVIRVLVPNLVQEVYPPGEVIFNEVSTQSVHLAS